MKISITMFSKIGWKIDITDDDNTVARTSGAKEGPGTFGLIDRLPMAEQRSELRSGITQIASELLAMAHGMREDEQ